MAGARGGDLAERSVALPFVVAHRVLCPLLSPCAIHFKPLSLSPSSLHKTILFLLCNWSLSTQDSLLERKCFEQNNLGFVWVTSVRRVSVRYLKCDYAFWFLIGIISKLFRCLIK